MKRPRSPQRDYYGIKMGLEEQLWNSIETKSDIESIESLVKTEGICINKKNIFDEGWTALHYAVNENYLQAA